MKQSAGPDAVIFCEHTCVLCIIPQVNHQHRQEVDLPVRVHSVLVSREDLHVVLEPFDFDERLVGFTLKGHHGVLLIGTGVFQVLREANRCLRCNKKIKSETQK